MFGWEPPPSFVVILVGKLFTNWILKVFFINELNDATKSAFQINWALENNLEYGIGIFSIQLVVWMSLSTHESLDNTNTNYIWLNGRRKLYGVIRKMRPLGNDHRRSVMMINYIHFCVQAFKLFFFLFALVLPTSNDMAFTIIFHNLKHPGRTLSCQSKWRLKKNLNNANDDMKNIIDCRLPTTQFCISWTFCVFSLLSCEYAESTRFG